MSVKQVVFRVRYRYEKSTSAFWDGASIAKQMRAAGFLPPPALEGADTFVLVGCATRCYPRDRRNCRSFGFRRVTLDVDAVEP
ncbi:MAG: hypothetical protein IIC93_08340 [Chloroflexi bacterium]|nr:hypothetical protein [Chloroflexota bacterium]